MPKNATRNYRELRARLIRAGYTLRSFARQHGYAVPSVYCAARGTRAGVITTKIRQHLEELINAQ